MRTGGPVIPEEPARGREPSREMESGSQILRNEQVDGAGIGGVLGLDDL